MGLLRRTGVHLSAQPPGVDWATLVDPAFADSDVLVTDAHHWLEAEQKLANAAETGLVWCSTFGTPAPAHVAKRFATARPCTPATMAQVVAEARAELRFGCGRVAVWVIDDDKARLDRGGLWASAIDAVAQSVQVMPFGSWVPQDGSAWELIAGWRAEVIEPVRQRGCPLVVIVDQVWGRGDGGCGLGWCRSLRQILPHALVLCASAVSAPTTDPDDAHDILIIGRDGQLDARGHVSLDRALRHARRPWTAVSPRSFGGFLTRDRTLQAALDGLLKRAGNRRSPNPTLTVVGASGTGKEALANWWHKATRPRKPWVPQAANSLPKNEVGITELVGIEGGVASSVVERPGLIEAANGGTLFLDELQDLCVGHRAILKRALDPGEVLRTGARTARRVDVQWVFATSQVEGLRAALGAGWSLGDLRGPDGAFEVDLLARFNRGEVLRIPPLRERPADIGLLARHFLILAGHPGTIAPEAEDLLLRHEWPGEARELDRVMRDAAATSGDSEVLAEHLGNLGRDGYAWCAPTRRLAAFEASRYGGLLIQDDDEVATELEQAPAEGAALVTWLRALGTGPPGRAASGAESSPPERASADPRQQWMGYLRKHLGLNASTTERAVGEALARYRRGKPKLGADWPSEGRPARADRRGKAWEEFNKGFALEWAGKPEAATRILTGLFGAISTGSSRRPR